MRRAAVVFLALIFVPAAHASGPAVSIQASATNGPAPLSITLTASGDPALYHWDLGDGTTADGPVVQHVFPAGRFGSVYVRAEGRTHEYSATAVADIGAGAEVTVTGAVGDGLVVAAIEAPPRARVLSDEDHPPRSE